MSGRSGGSRAVSLDGGETSCVTATRRDALDLSTPAASLLFDAAGVVAMGIEEGDGCAFGVAGCAAEVVGCTAEGVGVAAIGAGSGPGCARLARISSSRAAFSSA